MGGSGVFDCLGVLLVVVWFCFCEDKISLYYPGCSGTPSVNQAGLELRDLSVLVRKACATFCLCFHLFKFALVFFFGFVPFSRKDVRLCRARKQA